MQQLRERYHTVSAHNSLYSYLPIQALTFEWIQNGRGNSASKRRREYFRGNRFAGHGGYMYLLERQAKLEVVGGVCCVVFQYNIIYCSQCFGFCCRHGQSILSTKIYSSFRIE